MTYIIIGYHHAFQIRQNMNFLFYAVGFRKKDYMHKNKIRISRTTYVIFKNGTLGACSVLSLQDPEHVLSVGYRN